MSIERIVWLDHCSTGSSEWQKMSDILDLAPLSIVTIGPIVKETDTYLIVCPTQYEPSDDNELHGYGETA